MILSFSLFFFGMEEAAERHCLPLLALGSSHSEGRVLNLAFLMVLFLWLNSYGKEIQGDWWVFQRRRK